MTNNPYKWPNVKRHKNTDYFRNYSMAAEIRDQLQDGEWPNARVVEYQRGFAVQYYLSGPYYPEREE